MVTKLNHPLKIAEGYVLMKDRVEAPKLRVRNKNLAPKRDVQKVYLNQKLAEKYGEPKTYFYPYTAPRRARAFLILGSGNTEKGYLKYLNIKRDVLKRFKSIALLLKRDRQLRAFSLYLTHTDSYLSSYISRLNEKGITSYMTLVDTHNINKQYEIFLKENK